MGNTALFPTIVSLYKTFLTRIFTVERTTQNRNVFVLTMSSSDFSTVERATQHRTISNYSIIVQDIFNSNFHRGADHSKPQCFSTVERATEHRTISNYSIFTKHF